MRLLDKCPLCAKPLILTSSYALDGVKLNEYKCGHVFDQEVLRVDQSTLNLASVNGDKQARPYQADGVEFILESGFNAIIGDQMRLGKTPQSLLALKNAYAERTPCLIVVRSANLWQWIREYKVWTDSLPLGIYPIVGSKGFIPPGFSAYIISMDTFSRVGMSDKLLTFGFKLCIVDEAHSFKNVDSKRSQALIAFLKSINVADITHEIPFACPICRHQWTETFTVRQDSMAAEQRVSKTTSCAKCMAVVRQTAAAHVKVTRKCGVIMLSGTSIKNRADEYFVPLNIVAPSVFPSLERFRRQWLMQDQKGKWSRVSPYAFNQFKEVIKPYVLRREKEDVYTDLPKLNRMFTVVEVMDDKLKEAYNRVLKTIESNMERGNYKFFDNIGELMLLRQICGMAKVQWTADYVEASLLDSDSAKIAIGIHHHGVRDALAYQLAQFGVVKLSGEDSAERKDRIMRDFEHSPDRCLVINMLAGGVGMDFHYVDNILVLERQWSSADEEQFEYRFYNPDKSIKNRPTNVEYIIAKNTIDEWFYELVEEKRKIFGETISNNWSLTEDTSSFKDLLEKTVSHRL